MTFDRPIRVAVLVSGHGRGSNLQALIDGCYDGRINGTIEMVVGTRSDAPALDRAKSALIVTKVVSPKQFEGDNIAYGVALLDLLNGSQIDLICLAGYMRVLPGNVVRNFAGRVLNIHPSLLPKYGGKGMFGEYVHTAVLAAGDIESGCTVHFVEDGYDTGPIALQSTVPVMPNDTPESLAARVLVAEHDAYVEAVRLFALNRLPYNPSIQVDSPTIP
ncbi:MAG: phosphoribosylglycinamide formyltransferase [Chthonomonadales bacterium]